jgi:chromosome segregation ATPase
VIELAAKVWEWFAGGIAWAFNRTQSRTAELEAIIAQLTGHCSALKNHCDAQDQRLAAMQERLDAIDKERGIEREQWRKLNQEYEDCEQARMESRKRYSDLEETSLQQAAQIRRLTAEVGELQRQLATMKRGDVS